MKRLICLIFAVVSAVVLCSVFAVTAFAEKEVSYMKTYESDSGCDYHKYKKNVATVTILNKTDTASLEGEDTIEFWDVSAENDESIMAWMKLNEKETNSATTEKGLSEATDETKRYDVYIGSENTIGISDGSFLFYDFVNVKAINGLEFLNTANATNIESMFCNCKKLTVLNLSSFNTENVTNISNMFSCCFNLLELNISGWNTENVKSASNFFPGYTKSTIVAKNFIFNNETIKIFKNNQYLINIDLKNINTSKVTDMSWIFYECMELKNVDLSSFDTSNVTTMTNMFCDCNSLITLDLSSFDTSKVIDMSGMFSNCKSLRNLNLSGFDTSNVTKMNNMFSFCEIRNLDLKSFDTSKVTNMCSMFEGCIGLTSLDLSNFDTSNVTNMCIMFRNCKELKSLNLLNWNTIKVSTINSMFSFCKKLREINCGTWTGMLKSNCNIKNTLHECSNIIIKSNTPNFNTSDFGKLVCTINDAIFIYNNSFKEYQSITINVNDNITKNISEVIKNIINEKELSYTSDNPSIATIDKDGNIKGVSVGTTNINGIVEGTDNVILITVTVKKALTSTTPSTNPTSDTSSKTGIAAFFQKIIDFFKKLFGG